MIIDWKETALQLRALVRICFVHPNSWREIAIAVLAVIFAPVVVLVCLLANTHFRSSAD